MSEMMPVKLVIEWWLRYWNQSSVWMNMNGLTIWLVKVLVKKIWCKCFMNQIVMKMLVKVMSVILRCLFRMSETWS